jgi:hypothetical protein
MTIHWNRSSITAIFALAAIAATVLLGALFGHVLGTAKAFFLIVVAMTIWSVAGWFFGGTRAVLVGLTALAGALMVCEGAYGPAFIFSCAAALVLIADVGPRAQNRVPI